MLSRLSPKTFLALSSVLLLSGMAPAAQTGRVIQGCPGTPNCVSSIAAAADDHHVMPFRLAGSSENAWSVLRTMLKSQERTVIVEDADGYIHAEAASRVFGFIDDVEFLLDPSKGLIHVRSASRVGYWDLGVNRRRIESLREQLYKMGVIG